jgi:hypothetical protein
MTLTLKGTRAGITVISRQKGKRLITSGVNIPYPVTAFMQNVLSQTTAALALSALGAPNAGDTSYDQRLGADSKTLVTAPPLNSVVESGFYRLQTGHADMPPGYDFSIMTVARGSNTLSQTIVGYNTGKIMARGGANPGASVSYSLWAEYLSKVETDARYQLKKQQFTVATLPSASAAGQGTTYFVTDANASTFYSIVVGGGTIKINVTSDGSAYRIG